MHLKRITLHGFKSFAHPTTLELEPGVTAVVGPNGCGKSNIVDAIRWVLGEQSAKALRGDNMADVIFGGSPGKKPLGFCEVKLLFTGCAQALRFESVTGLEPHAGGGKNASNTSTAGSNAQFEEVEVSRRVTREGQGTYRINGKACRLRDIQALFMDTGIGQSSYSFMAQGQISQIIDATPLSRRNLFEEAAGITRFKAQRKECLRKLEGVEQNLSRVSDVMAEVDSSLRSLKRQASKALRAERLQHRFKHLDLAHCTHTCATASETLEAAQTAHSGKTKASEQAQTAIATAEAAAEEQRSIQADLSAAHGNAQEAFYEARSETERVRSAQQWAAKERESLQTRMARLTGEVNELKTEEAQLRQRMAEESTETGAKAGTVDVFAQRAEELAKRTGDAADALEALEAELETLRGNVRTLEAERTKLRSEATRAEIARETARGRLSDLEQTLQTASAQSEGLAAQTAEKAEAAQALETQLESANAAALETAEAASAARETFKNTQASLADAERAAARLEAERSLLSGQQARFEGFSGGTQKLLAGKVTLPKGARCVPLSDVLEVPQQHAAALEAALGDVLEGVLPITENAENSENADALVALVDAVEAANPGRVSLQTHLAGMAQAAETAYALQSNLPEFLVPLASVVTLRAGAEVPPQLESLVPALFAGTYICTQPMQHFVQWRAQQGSNFPFRWVATESGQRMDSAGTLRLGAGSAAQGSASLLGRAAQLEALTEKCAAAGAELASVQATAGEVSATLEAAETAQQTAADTARALKNEFESVASSLKNMQAEAERAESITASASQQKELNETALAEAETALAQHSSALETAEANLEAAQASAGAMHAKRETARVVWAEAKEALSALELERTHSLREAELTRQKQAALQRELARLEAQQAQRTEELTALAQQQQTASEALGNQQGELERAGAAQEAAKAALETAANALSESEAPLQAAQAALTAARKQAEQLASSAHSAEVELERLRTQLQFKVDHLREAHGVEPGQVSISNVLWIAERGPQQQSLADLLDENEDGVEGEASEAGEGAEQPATFANPEAAQTQPGAPREPTDAELAALENPDWEATALEINDLKARIAALGSVNPDAINTYAEKRQRYTFLKTQSDDLWESKTTLTAAIEELNAESTQRFNETFQAIRGHFKNTYKQLANGTADLKLHLPEPPAQKNLALGAGESEAESDEGGGAPAKASEAKEAKPNPALEAGIEIFAQPAGTRLKNLSLLSGGQKTMAAVALLFAIYQVKPSPFCVLDELDAPLDDANIARFTDTLRSFLGRSQFLVITHNKRTLHAADVLYGVTMQEPGITRMVSLKFSKTTGETEEVEGETATIGDVVTA